MHRVWAVLIDFVAGFVARAITPGGVAMLVALTKMKDQLANHEPLSGSR